MKNLMKELYRRYGDFSYNFGQPLSLDIALRIYINGAENIEDLEQKIKAYEVEKLKNKEFMNRSELGAELDALQPNSFSLQLIYIWLLLDSMEEEYFSITNIKRNDLYRIIHALTSYLLFLQTYTFTDLSIPKSAAKKIFGRRDFLVGITELKKVSSSITEQDYTRFCELFALDVNDNSMEKLIEVELFKDGEYIFLFWINDFLKYIILDIEKKYREWSKTESFSTDKGSKFEEIVYGFISQFYNDSVHNVFYHEPNKKSEIDLIIRDRKHLIITECKSGTIDLRDVKSDKEIIQKLNFKLKKAYNTLDSVVNYINNNDTFEFVGKNKEVALSGQSNDYDFIYLHVSMYPIDALSSSIHILNDKYYLNTKKPKLTISFEHFLAICVDCHEKSKSLGEYLAKRRDLLISHPNMKFDNNELDLYYQLTNKSMLNDSIANGILEKFNPDIKIITTFRDYEGNEMRPASNLLLQLEHRLFNMFIESSNSSIGLNKRFINYTKQYETILKEDALKTSRDYIKTKI